MGAQKLDKTSQNSLNVEEFLAGLRFEQRGKLDELFTEDHCLDTQPYSFFQSAILLIRQGGTSGDACGLDTGKKSSLSL